MPILKSAYKPSNLLFRNPHIASIYPTQFRKIKPLHPLIRQRIITPDGDFLDVDASEQRHGRLAMLFHGFEGSSTRPYMMGMAKKLQKENWDVLAMNHRGCSSEPNTKASAYNAGDFSDMAFVIEKFLEERNYTSLSLIGFSLGGNILMNYLARSTSIPDQVKSGVAISTPVDLRRAVFQLMKPVNWLYHRNFYRKLIRKMKYKQSVYPDLLPYDHILQARNLDDFDEYYTAPFHGFRDAAEYREQSSSLPVLDQLQRPSLLLNAKDDPFLTESCYPYEIAANSDQLFLMTPDHGGHCGFWQPRGVYYHEQQCVQFMERFG